MKLTGHAKERMAEMDVSADEVYEVLRNPETVYPSTQEGRETRVGGRLAVVVEGKKVVTVLWRGKESR